jgi:hypothetical protein
MYALTTPDGLPMAETAICARCYPGSGNRLDAAAGGHLTGDWDGGRWEDASRDDTLACVICGRDGEGELRLSWQASPSMRALRPEC